MTTSSAITLSKWIYKYCENNGISDLSNIKMQKLLYYCTGIAKVFGFERFSEIDFEAWQYGPVNRECYEVYKDFGASAIKMNYEPIMFDEAEERVLEAVMKIYSKYRPFELVEQTHIEDPWKSAWERNAIDITSASIERYFKSHYEIGNSRPPSTFVNDAFFSIDGIPVKRFRDLFAVADYISEYV